MSNYVTAIGLDVHARSIKACALNPMTGEVERASFGYDPASVAEWALSFESPKAVYESGVTGFHLCRALRALGLDCAVGAVSKMQRPAAVDGVRIADKAVLKMMGEMGLRCGILRETDRHRYSSYRGRVGETFENVLGRYFATDAPWRKMGTDDTEFKLSFGRAHQAPVYGFGSEEIVAHSISLHPDLAHQEEMLGMPMEAKPEGVSPIPHSDMGWRYQHAAYVRRLAENGFTQSMSRKGDCLDNGATEQVFGHLKDEFFRGRDWDTFEGLKADLEAYIRHWNHVRRQRRLKGLTPVEFREQALREAA